MIMINEVTTARVVAAPTPSAPPDTLIPSKQDTTQMIEEKISVLKRPEKISLRHKGSKVILRYKKCDKPNF